MRTRALIGALLLTGAAGCDSITNVSRELAIAITADRTSLPAGEDVRINYDASGAFLTRVVIDFGDGSDQALINTAGAQTATGNQLHSYAAAGTYTVTGIALEASGERKEAQITIEVSGTTP
ncbi:MAG: hypothetical protein ACRELX_06460 [Longimicrobiales bacterium]